MECPYQKITYFARERFYIVCTNLRVRKCKCDEKKELERIKQ